MWKTLKISPVENPRKIFPVGNSIFDQRNVKAVLGRGSHQKVPILARNSGEKNAVVINYGDKRGEERKKKFPHFPVSVCRADSKGEVLRAALSAVQLRYPHVIREVRGRGLLNAVEVDPVGLGGVSATDICMRLKERGVLAKPTHSTIIRLAPPLTMR